MLRGTICRRLAPPAMISAPEVTQRLRASVVALPDWQLRAAEADKAAALQKSFRFRDFHAAFDFMTRCAPFINVTDHHPEWFNVYNRVEVTLTTHDCKGVSEKDFALAAEMQRIAEQLPK